MSRTINADCGGEKEENMSLVGTEKFKPIYDGKHTIAKRLESLHIAEFDSIKDAKQKIYKFDNGYGASIVKGLTVNNTTMWELAVIEFDFEGKNHVITYNTPIADDVIQNLTLDEVEIFLKKINKLPPLYPHKNICKDKKIDLVNL